MLYAILAILALGVIFVVVEKIATKFAPVFKVLWKIFKVWCIISIIFFAISMAFEFYYIVIPIVALLIYYMFSNKKKLKEWVEEKSPIFTEEQVDDLLIPIIDSNIAADNNVESYKFNNTKLPFGRVNAFLNYFEKSIYTDEVYYFSALRSCDSNELREYGTAITRNGIYISKQVSGGEGIKVEEKVNPFAGLRELRLNESTLTLNYVNPKDISENTITLSNQDTTIPIINIKEICNKVIESKVNHALCKGGVVTREEYIDKINEANKKQDNEQFAVNAENIGTVAGVMGASQNFSEQYNEVKNYMNGSRGHGYGAEYGNNTIDKLKGNDVVNAAQNLDENGRQVKHGADRIVNGQEIQTKYYKTASESIGAAFEQKNAIYINSDGSGKMMAIEVPRDQYNEAVRLMQKRIDSGQVPNVEPGEDARDYVKKGYFTYAQSFNICKSGTIESLAVDAIDGAICSSVAGGDFCSYCIWNCSVEWTRCERCCKSRGKYWTKGSW